MLKKITVYGKLRRFLGQSTFEADVNTPREAFSFLYCNFKGVEEIKIIPVVHGNFFTFVLGLALKYGAKKYITNKILTTVVSYVATSLILKGANDLLAPQQDTRNPVSNQDSLDPSALATNYSFTGLTNISNAGVPVNIAYGEILVGSIVVSNGVDTVQVEGTN